MTRRRLIRLVTAWAALTAVATVTVHCGSRIGGASPPPDEARRWAFQALEAARLGEPAPSAPDVARHYRAAGPIFVHAWSGGRSVARYEGPSSLVRTVRRAAKAFANHPTLGSMREWSARGEERVRFSISVVLGEGPLVLDVPYLSELGLVPLHEGLVARLGSENAYALPEELLAKQRYDHGVPLPVPDLSFGVPMDALVDRLGRELGVDGAELRARGSVRRLKAATLTEYPYPRDEPVTERALRKAAVEGAEFLVRHQRPTGRYTYVYDARTGRERPAYYNLPRHAGTTWFLALVDSLHGMPEAREGALAALGWLERYRMHRCGGEDRWCVAAGRIADAGSSALATIAAAEVLEAGDDPLARRMVEGLTAFLRSLQRDDGELMHEFDLEQGEPIDVQHMYYSGEAALALLKAHRVLGDERNLEAARRLMKHLTGAGWSFLGSRYYYGEEHWTCIAAGEAADRIDSPAALDFCQRWAGFNREIQYRAGETPWDVAGAYGVGPIIIPRTTPVGSRTEAFISTYEMALQAGTRDETLRRQIERGLAGLLRWRWNPGPVHLFARPLEARGGVPGSPVDLTARNDIVQHAGSAMIRWADVLRRERTGQ